MLIDVHARYRLSDDWFLNAYGGFPVTQKTNRPGVPMMPMMDNTHYERRDGQNILTLELGLGTGPR